ncbi:MAG: hypothetical protein KGZ85_10535 [Ignavibacterium sp.]|nr:hypothetical protein [Ignavibacterium sp.]MBS4034893.1 hypothetical protein [Ignavibacterium sp.]
MGQQQLLLIVLGVIVVGIAILLGILLFRASAIENKRDILIVEGTSIAAVAQQYYRKPSEIGGGSRSFLGWDIPPSFRVTTNGYYNAEEITADQVVIIGTGNEEVTGGDSIKVRITATGTNILSEVIN